MNRRASEPPMHQQHVATNQAITNLFPTSGHQADLNHLWAQVQELSDLLASNRDNTVQLVKRTNDIKSRINPKYYNELFVEGDDQEQVDWEAEARHLREENLLLVDENESLTVLVNDYETVLEKILEGLRVYAHDHSISTINIHHSYANQLAKERQTNVLLRQNAAESQAKLSRLSSLLREAHEAEFALGPDIVIEELKAENASLREALDMPQEVVDSDLF